MDIHSLISSKKSNRKTLQGNRYIHHDRVLGELLYPIAFRPLDPAHIRTGDICIVPAGAPTQNIAPHQIILKTRTLYILKVTP